MNSREYKIEDIEKNEDKFHLAEYFSLKNEFWDSVYRENLEKDRFIHIHMRKRKQIVFDYLDSFSRGNSIKVIDVGCGTGIYLEEMVKKGYGAAGVDLSPEMVKNASNKLSLFTNVLSDAVCADVEKLPFPDNYFDAATCVGVLEYMKNDQTTLNELKRVVKTRGAIIFTLPNKYKIKNLLDPYYYLVRIWQYLFVRLRLKKKKNNDLFRYSSNETFTNKRYSLNQLKNIVLKSGLDLRGFSSLGFGPLTLWQKEFIPLKISLRISNFLENQSKKHQNAILNKIPNRWVVFTIKK